MNFNTAISQMMIFVNAAYKEDVLPREYAEGFLKLLNPVAPHITEELWQTALGNNDTIAYSKWPEFDESKTIDDEIDLPVQVNGKVRKTIKVPLNSDEQTVKDLVHKECSSLTQDKTIVKEIYVKNKIYNIVVK